MNPAWRFSKAVAASHTRRNSSSCSGLTLNLLMNTMGPVSTRPCCLRLTVSSISITLGVGISRSPLTNGPFGPLQHGRPRISPLAGSWLSMAGRTIILHSRPVHLTWLHLATWRPVESKTATPHASHAGRNERQSITCSQGSTLGVRMPSLWSGSWAVIRRASSMLSTRST